MASIVIIERDISDTNEQRWKNQHKMESTAENSIKLQILNVAQATITGTNYDHQFYREMKKNTDSETFPSSILSSKALTLPSTFSTYKRKQNNRN